MWRRRREKGVIAELTWRLAADHSCSSRRCNRHIFHSVSIFMRTMFSVSAALVSPSSESSLFSQCLIDSISHSLFCVFDHQFLTIHLFKPVCGSCDHWIAATCETHLNTPGSHQWPWCEAGVREQENFQEKKKTVFAMFSFVLFFHTQRSWTDEMQVPMIIMIKANDL